VSSSSMYVEHLSGAFTSKVDGMHLGPRSAQVVLSWMYLEDAGADPIARNAALENEDIVRSKRGMCTHLQSRCSHCLE
jgi:hypothetical protein